MAALKPQPFEVEAPASRDARPPGDHPGELSRLLAILGPILGGTGTQGLGFRV